MLLCWMRGGSLTFGVGKVSDPMVLGENWKDGVAPSLLGRLLVIASPGPATGQEPPDGFDLGVTATGR